MRPVRGGGVGVEVGADGEAGWGGLSAIRVIALHSGASATLRTDSARLGQPRRSASRSGAGCRRSRGTDPQARLGEADPAHPPQAVTALPVPNTVSIRQRMRCTRALSALGGASASGLPQGPVCTTCGVPPRAMMTRSRAAPTAPDDPPAQSDAVPSPPPQPEHGSESNCAAPTQARPRTGLIIPTPVNQNRCAHLRMPMNMIRQG
jgi:hypothetical protein